MRNGQPIAHLGTDVLPRESVLVRLRILSASPDHHVNDGAIGDVKTTLPEISIAGPALTVFESVLAIAWTGTDPDHHLDVSYVI
jgi:hypothetical protein